MLSSKLARQFSCNCRISLSVRGLPVGRVASVVVGAVLAVAVFLLPQTAAATHIVGGEMTYRCLGNDQYEITLVVYRDCFYGDPLAYFDDPAYVGVFDGNNDLVETRLIPFMMVDDTLSGQSFNPCLRIPDVYCVHSTIYRDTVVLDPALANGGYTIAYQRCCRNQTLVNIFDPVETGATFSTVISEAAMAVCNSSAVFPEWPPIAICVNEPLVYNHAATDADGDSLVYRLCTPFAGGTINDGQPTVPSNPPFDTVVWASPPFSLTNMLGGVPLAINAQTGQITATPSIIGQFSVGVCVEEYRDGELLSVTRRDFQYNVTVCDEITAGIAEVEPDCGDLEIQFHNQSAAADAFLWSFLRDTVVIGQSTETHPLFLFPDTGLYTVRLIAMTANGCADTATTEVYLFNDGIIPDFDILVLDCDGSVLVDVINLTQDPGSNLLFSVWELRTDFNVVVVSGSNPQFVVQPFDIPYELTLTVTSVNGCVEKDSLEFFLKPIGPPDQLNDTITLCQGDTADIMPVFAPGYIYSWSPTIGLSNPDVPNPKAFPDSTTVYTLQISDSSGQCQIERTVTALVIEQVVEPGLGYSCDGYEVTFEYSGQPGESYFWDFGVLNQDSDTSTDLSPTFTYPDSGSYTYQLIRVSDPSCGSADTLIGVVETGIASVRGAFDAEYAACQTDSIQIVISDQSEVNRDSIVMWQWTIGNEQFSGSKPPPVQLYQSTDLLVNLIVTTAEGCRDSIQEILPVLLAKTEGLKDTLFICPGDSIPLFPGADNALAFEWMPSEGLSDPFSANPMASPDTPTTYLAEVGAFGLDTCLFSFAVTVIPVSGPTLTVPADTVVCESVVTLTALSEQGVDVLWFSASGSDTLAFGNDLITEPGDSAQYLVKAVNAFGCEVAQSVSVEGRMVNQTLLSADTLVCPGDQVLLSVEQTGQSDTVQWQWQPDSLLIGSGQGADVIFSSASPGAYELIVIGTNQSGCTASDTALISVSPAPEEIEVDAEQGCDGFGIQFLVDGPSGVAYTWIFGDGTDPILDIEPFHEYPSAGDFTVTVILGAGGACVDTLTKEIIVLDNSGSFSGQLPEDTTTCSDSITLQVTELGNGNLVWLDGDLFPLGSGIEITVIVSDTSTYFLQRTDTFGCTKIVDTVRVVQEGISLEMQPDQTICFGDEATISLSNPGNSLLFSAEAPGASVNSLSDSTLVVMPLQKGLVSVTISAQNASGCEGSDTVILTVLDTARLDGSIDLTQCTESTINFESSHPLASFIRWNFGDPSNPAAGATGSQVSYLYPGAGIYQGYAVLDSMSICSDTFYFDIEVASDAEFQYAVDWNYLSCDSPAVISIVDMSTFPLDSIVSQSWVFSTGDTLSGTPIEVTPDSNGVIQYSLFLSTANGCTGMLSDSFSVSVVDLSIADSLQICQGQTVFLNPNGDTSFLYNWQPVGSLDQSQVPNPEAAPEFSTLYSVEVLIPFSVDTCVILRDVFVEVVPPLQYSAPADAIFCDEQELTLQVELSSAVASIRWSSDPGFTTILSTSDTVSAQTGRPQIYYLELTDSSGCTYLDTIEIANYGPDVAILPNTGICLGDTILLEALNIYSGDSLTYFWEPSSLILSDAQEATVQVAPETPTVFLVEYINQYGCMGTDSVSVIVTDAGSISATATPDTIALGGSSQLEATGMPGVTYLWSPDDGTLDNPSVTDPIATPDVTTTYQVGLTTPEGCTAEASVTVFVVQRSCIEPYIFVPQAFSPNGDGQNDRLFVYGNPIEELEFVIYNRWGEKVFETRDQSQGWNGSFRNEIQPPDVYAYYLKVLCINGEEFVKKGNVTLLR